MFTFWYRHLSFREALVALAIVAISIAAKESNNKFEGMDQDVLELGAAPDSYVVGDEPAGPFPVKLGLRYEHVQLMGIDFWRSDGHLIAYERNLGGLSYVDLSDAEVAELGISKPWRYYLPEGLIVLACLAELFLVSRKKRTVRFALITGGLFGAIALVFRLGGLTWEWTLPGLIAVHHIGTALATMFLTSREGLLEDADPPHDDARERPRVPRPSTPPHRPSAVDANPFRAPPQPPPVVVRASTAPAEIPIAHDPNAAAPKLLT